MDQDLDILSGDQPEGGDGRLRGGDVVVPVGQPKREILTEIADRGREDFHAWRNAIERRRERVGSARGGNADNDDFATERLRIESASTSTGPGGKAIAR